MEGGGGSLDAGLVAHIEGEWKCYGGRAEVLPKKKAPVMGAFFVKK